MSSVITSPGETIVFAFGLYPEMSATVFLFFGNLTSTDIIHYMQWMCTVYGQHVKYNRGKLGSNELGNSL